MANLVVKENTLINASYRLNLIEQRLILLAIIKARETNTGITANDPLTICAKSYMNHFNTTQQASYMALKEACENLFERRFSYQNLTLNKKIKNITSRWVSQIAYIEDNAEVELIFSPAVVPFITELESHFTSYDIEQVSQLNSAYAVRLYELLIAWRSTGKTPVFKLEDLRNKLGVNPDELNRIDNFKMRILDASIDQINQHTDIRVKYEQHKAGRTITGFTFTFRQIKQAHVVDGFEVLSEKQIALYSYELSKISALGSLAPTGCTDYRVLSKLIAEILRNPSHFPYEKSEKVFIALRTKTDFKPLVKKKEKVVKNKPKEKLNIPNEWIVYYSEILSGLKNLKKFKVDLDKKTFSELIQKALIEPSSVDKKMYSTIVKCLKEETNYLEDLSQFPV
jgi:plasmid replication initiation protein